MYTIVTSVNSFRFTILVLVSAQLAHDVKFYML